MEYFGDWQNLNIFEQSAKWKIFTLNKGKKEKKNPLSIFVRHTMRLGCIMKKCLEKLPKP